MNKQELKREFELIRQYEKLINYKYLDWTDDDYNKFEQWKEALDELQSG